MRVAELDINVGVELVFAEDGDIGNRRQARGGSRAGNR